MTKLYNPVPLFLDARGTLMDGGFIYVGVANADPGTSPINVYWDEARTVPAAQPLRTIGGLVVNGTTPASVFFSKADFSMRTKDSSGSLVNYSPSTSASASFQPLDSDLTTISAAANTAFGLALLTLANTAALKAATGIPDCLPLTGGTVTGNVVRSGSGAHMYGTDPAMTVMKLYPPLPVGSSNPATGAGSLQGFY